MEKLFAGVAVAVGVTAGVVALGNPDSAAVSPIRKALDRALPGALSWLSKKPERSCLVLGAGAAVGLAGLIFLTPYPIVPLKIAKQKRNLAYLWHPSEIISMVGFKFFATHPGIPKNISENSNWCYQKLMQTSRSFAAVILELHEELREAVRCIWTKLGFFLEAPCSPCVMCFDAQLITSILFGLFRRDLSGTFYCGETAFSNVSLGADLS